MSQQKQGMDLEARAYFDSLPQVLKSQIVESGAKLCTRQELEAYCRNTLGAALADKTPQARL
ncbi:MAG: hypothetical protein K2P33_03575 [Acutalibacter sp.]|nr:hypothetical protein [Acutalibacter sp.]